MTEKRRYTVDRMWMVTETSMRWGKANIKIVLVTADAYEAYVKTREKDGREMTPFTLTFSESEESNG